MINPFNLGNEPIGIDLGASGAKLLQLRRTRRGLEAVATARIELPTEPGVSTGDAHMLAMAEAIKSTVTASGFAGEACVLSVDDSWLKFRSIRQPKMTDDERDGAIKIEGAQKLGFDKDDPGEIGWTVAGEVREADSVRQEVILVGAQSDALERLVFSIARVGLRPLAVEPGFMATARVITQRLRRQSDQNILNVIVDIGARHTGVMLTRGRQVVFYKSLQTGGDKLTDQVATRMGIERETVVDLRRRRMMMGAGGNGVSEIDPRVDRAMFDAVRPLMDEIAQEIALCLRYYSVTFRGAKPEKCILVGGEAAEPHFTEVVEQATRTTTVVGEPLADIATEGTQGYGANRRSSRCEWAVAAGLAMRQMEAPKMFGLSGGPQLRRSGGDSTKEAA